MAKTFITSDGYKLQQQPDGTWFDGDMTFLNAVWPVDANNEPLEGSYGPDEPASYDPRPQPEPKRFDVIASVNDLHSAGGDGAYDLIGEGQTIDEILAKLREQLETLHESLAQGGAYSSGFKFVPCYLSVNIGPAGSYENLPMDAAVVVPGMTPAMLRGKKPLTAKAVVQMKSEPEHHTFEEWLKEVDENLVDICCLTHERLPDVDYIGLYKTGNTPAEAADFAVQNMKNS